MSSPYLNRPARTVSEVIADLSASAQWQADHRLARSAVTFMLARFKDMKRHAGTAAQIAAYDREIAAMEAYLLRTSSAQVAAQAEQVQA